MKVLTALVGIVCLRERVQTVLADASCRSRAQDSDEVAALQTMLTHDGEMHLDLSASDVLEALSSHEDSPNDSARGTMEARPSAAVPGAPPDVVKFGILVKQFFGVDFSKSTFYVDLVLTLKWEDLRATDVVDQVGPASADHVVLSSTDAAQRIWLPHVSVTNHDINGLELVSSNIRVDRKGSVVQVERLLVRIPEAFDVSQFPFDTQTLRVKVASTTLMLDDVVLEPMFQQSQGPAISRFKNLSDCVVENVSRRNGSMVLDFEVTGDAALGKLQSPLESTLSWTGGRATPSSMRLIRDDPTRIGGELIFDEVPNVLGIDFTYGANGYSSVSVPLTTRDEANVTGIATSLFKGSEYSLVDSRLQSYEEITGPVRKSRGEFSFRAARSHQEYVQSVFLPACLMVGISWTVFFFPLDGPFVMPRVATSSLAFLALVTLAYRVDAQIPSRSGLAWIDIFMECTEILTSATIALNTTEIYIYHQMNMHAFANKLSRELQVIFFFLAIVTDVIVFSSAEGKNLIFTQIIVRLILGATIGGYIATAFWRMHLERVCCKQELSCVRS